MSDIKLTTATADDHKHRFLFEEMDLRGELVHLDRVLADVGAIHAYPDGVNRLLGEFLSAAVLLASTLKFSGKLTVGRRTRRIQHWVG